MGSDYNRWKKQRDAERQRQESEREAARARPPAPPPRTPYRPGESRQQVEPRRAYQGYIPPTPAAQPQRASRAGDTVRGCLGCAGLLVGALLLLAIALTIAGVFYWRQIEQRGAVNLLILGTDERPAETPPFRSDTMILAGFRPRQREVALLSIPRDLWVSIPEQGDNRINTAHFFGGPSLAKQTVGQNFGLPVHYYVKIDFDGFVSIIDALGGITVNVPEALHDENYPTPDYGITTIDIAAGEQQMDGATALIYARSRYSTSDFDRGRRQQQIIGAVRDKLARPSTWLKGPATFAAARSAVTSDLPLSEWPALALILIRSDIERATIGPAQTEEWITPMGAQVLLPLWEQINPTLAEHFD